MGGGVNRSRRCQEFVGTSMMDTHRREKAEPALVVLEVVPVEQERASAEARCYRDPVSSGSLLLLSLGLAMDAAAVSAARGLAVGQILPRHVLLVATFFGGAQALMPLAGWQIGSRTGALAQEWDHWIAFGAQKRSCFIASGSACSESPGAGSGKKRDHCPDPGS